MFWAFSEATKTARAYQTISHLVAAQVHSVIRRAEIWFVHIIHIVVVVTMELCARLECYILDPAVAHKMHTISCIEVTACSIVLVPNCAPQYDNERRIKNIFF